MADTPESLVYRGREGTGAAQIFGREGNPMRAYQQRKDDIEYKRQVAAKEEKLAKDKRDKDLWDLQNITPEKAWEPFNQQVLGEAAKLRQQTEDMVMKTGTVDGSVKTYARNGWDQVNALAAKSTHFKTLREEAIKSIDGNPYQKGALEKYYMPKFNDVFFNADGKAKSFDEIDTKALDEIVNDAGGYDLDKLADDLVKDPKTNITSKIQQWKDKNGIIHTRDNEYETPEFYDVDSNGQLIKDENGDPVINIKKSSIDMMVDGNDIRRRAVEGQAEQLGIAPEELIKEKLKAAILREKTGFKHKVSSQMSREPIAYQNYGDKQAKEMALATDRLVKVGHVLQNPFNEKGQATQEALSVIGGLRGVKHLDGNIVDAELVKGTNTPGTIDFKGNAVSNAPQNRVLLTIKTSDRGRPKVMELNLNDPGSVETLNGLLNNSPSETAKFSTGDLTRITGKDVNTIYGLGNNEGPSLQEAARIENDAVNRVMTTPIGKDSPDIVGKTLNGKKIVAAKKIETAAPRSVLGINLGTWGQKDAIEIEMSDGSLKEVTDPEEIRKIVKGEAPAKLKASYKQKGTGKTFTMKDLKAVYSDEEIQQAIQEGLIE